MYLIKQTQIHDSIRGQYETFQILPRKFASKIDARHYAEAHKINLNRDTVIYSCMLETITVRFTIEEDCNFHKACV